MAKTLIKIENLSKSFKKDDSQELLVLDNVNLSINQGEIIALLGKSGAGKTTLLRIIAGLMKPTTGKVEYNERKVLGPIKGISMVFQNSALMPWLSVLDNVELGLEAQGLNKEERRKRSLKTIDTIGLDGYESAYPKELSGGMQQRVGFARALVVNPEVLLMDEPFSALDVLTGENLKTDLIDLWEEGKTNTKCILLVTHSIEEAALLADRIIVLGSDPGYVIAEIPVSMKRPRNEQSKQFTDLVEEIYKVMTSGPEEIARRAIRVRQISLGYRLPDVEPAEISGLIETISVEFKNQIDLPELTDYLSMDIDDLFPLMETLEILELAHIHEGQIKLNDLGIEYADADILEKKKIFAKQLLANVPLARYIREILDEKITHRVSEERFLSRLEGYLSEKESERVLKTVIAWGRYAEIFAYDVNTGILSLENPG